MPPEYAVRIMRIMDRVWEQIDAQLEPARLIRAERRLPRLVEPRPGARKVLVTAPRFIDGASPTASMPGTTHLLVTAQGRAACARRRHVVGNPWNRRVAWAVGVE
jgi:hypothetical protein